MSATRGKASLPISYREQMEAEIAEINKRIAAPSGDRIRMNNNQTFRTPDGHEGDTLEVVIVDFMSTNLFYDGPYNRDNVQPPACFAIGPEPSLMVPSTNSPDRQAESCSSCPMNQFGSALTGKGKACKNTRLIAVKALDNDEVWIMSIPPTSLKSFDSYVSSLATSHKTSPIGVVTQISLDKSVQFSAPRFHVVRPLDDEELGASFAKRDTARARLTAEPDVSNYEAPKRLPGRGR